MRCLSRIRPTLSIVPVSTSLDTERTSARSMTISRKLSAVIKVRPEDVKEPVTTASSKVFSRIQPLELAGAVYHWTTCLFIVGLVCSQLLGAVWNYKTTQEHLIYGRSPLLGPSQIIGTNDVPYTDRAVACVRLGRFYKPRLVSSLLADPGVSSVLEDSTGFAVHGYRLKQRRAGSIEDSLDSVAEQMYEASCALIASTIDNIFEGCVALGYNNLTRGHLRVVDDWDSKNLYSLLNTLPVLITPFWDNALYARHAVPTWDGDACVFHLEDAYTGNGGDSALASFRGVNQSVRHERTIEWLNRPGGKWKNGWYEDLEGVRWYSDVMSSAKAAPYFMVYRVFDMRSGRELDCSSPIDCEGVMRTELWGDKFSSSSRASNFNSVSIANATEFGLFIYESFELRVVHNVFDWETLVSSLSVGIVLFRWVVALASLHSGAFRGNSRWFSCGIGCVSEATSFRYLPLVSLPRLNMTLTAFWTVGCKFEGQQCALSEAWFVIYPSIAHFVLIYYSLLNGAAKVLRCRVSDVLFTPTVVVLSLLHYFRLALAESGWLVGVDGRVPTLIFSDEVQELRLIDYFTTDTAWRMNGGVAFLFAAKWAILAINLVPLIVARSFPIKSDFDLKGVEKAFALRVRHVGGLGQSSTYAVAEGDRNNRRLSSAKVIKPKKHDQRPPSDERVVGDRQGADQELAFVNSYELIRLGYLVFGDKYVVTFDEWDLLSSMAPFRAYSHFWNHRVFVWTLRPEGDAEIAGGRALECTEPQMWRLDDPRLQNIQWWHVSACSIQC